jgi:hypothetical protein
MKQQASCLALREGKRKAFGVILLILYSIELGVGTSRIRRNTLGRVTRRGYRGAYRTCQGVRPSDAVSATFLTTVPTSSKERS